MIVWVHLGAIYVYLCKEGRKKGALHQIALGASDSRVPAGLEVCNCRGPGTPCSSLDCDPPQSFS